MTECEVMSQEKFDANEDHIRAVVDALMRDTHRRKKFRVLRLRETHTKEYLAEVFAIPGYGPVIAHHSYGDPDLLSRVVVHAPRGRGKLRPVVAPLTDDPNQRFPIMARSFQYRLPVERIRQWIEDGETEVFITHSVSKPAGKPQR